MTRLINRLIGAALLSGLAFAQSPEPKPAFEIADVHTRPPTRNVFRREPVLRAGRYEIRMATMAELIGVANGIDPTMVLGGPRWLENDLYAVTAKAPPGATLETARPMLQSLLTERFSLVSHKDSRSVPAFALKAGKRPQLKPAADSEVAECKFTPPTPPPPGAPQNVAPTISYACRNMTMAAFANALSTTIILGQDYLNQKAVVDQSELKGSYDFDFKYTPPAGMMGPLGPDVKIVTLFDAVEKLGLRLDPVVVPLPVIVVDSVAQKPTPNLPNVAERLHSTAPPTEFEVAELKPTDPEFRGMRLQLQPGGRVNIAGTPLKFLIEQAWDLTDEMLAGAPKWMETDRYDIVAKAGGTSAAEMDIEDLWPMLRTLLTERFKLATHMEDRSVTAYTLTAVKPRMKQADPASHMKYKEGPSSDGKDPRNGNPVLGRLVTCQNMTMAEFAEKLQRIAPGYIHTPVRDATGLEGGYDFTLSFSPAGAVQGGGRSGNDRGAPGGTPSADDSAAADPNGAVTLFTAIEKQLGLKLASGKRPVPVLVIDHAEQKPVEN